MSVSLMRCEEFALLTLDRPETLNALSFEIVTELGHLFDDVAEMDVRGLIVTGAGDKAFCAGADVTELLGQSALAHRENLARGQAVFAKIPRLPVPSVAMVNGYAFGGGLELALACTFRLALPHAKLGLPEIKLGLTPGYGGTQRLPRLVGEGRALEMVLTGRAVDADEAERIGLVNRVVEGDPIEAAIDFAREWSRFSLPVLACARSAVTRALDLPIHDGLEVEADVAGLVYTTEDAAEGMRAFIDKRRPDFRDR